MAEFIPIEEFISKYEKQYETNDYSEFENSFNFKNGNTARSKDIMYVNPQKGVNLNVHDMFHVENSKYDKLNVLCKSKNNKEIMTYVISVLKSFPNENCKIKDLYNSDSFDFYPFEVICNFEEAYNLSVKLNNVKDKTILKHFIEKLVDCKFELKMHSITRNPSDKEKLTMRFTLNIHVPLLEPIDYNKINYTAFQIYIKHDDTFINHLFEFMQGKNLSIFPFLYIKPNYLGDLCELFGYEYKFVEKYLIQKRNVGGTESNFDSFMEYHYSKQCDEDLLKF